MHWEGTCQTPTGLTKRRSKRPAKAAGKAIDLVQSMNPAIANAYGILIGDRIAAARERNLDATTRKTRKILEERKLKDAQPVPEQIAVPLLEEAQRETRETIQDLYAALLANAMDGTYSGDVGPEFIDIVKQLQPIDAEVLKFAWEKFHVGRKVFNMGELTGQFGRYRPTAVQLSIENLQKLKCVGSHPQGLVLSPIGFELFTAFDPHTNR
jgi:hypothetical protein